MPTHDELFKVAVRPVGGTNPTHHYGSAIGGADD
jgi:hypothetical protein